MRKTILAVLLALILPSCKTVQYVPLQNDTEVHIIDSVAIHYLDSIRIYEATRYREMGWLTDTLRVKTERGTEVTVFADTVKELLTADVKEKPVEEKTKYVFKDRLVFKDSIRTVEKPVPVEVTKEVKYIPKFYRIFTIIGVLLTSVLGVIGFFKLKNKGFLSRILKIFRK